MRSGIGSRLKPFVPPFLLDAIRHLRRPVINFEGSYRSWNEAAAAATGYDSQEILDRVAAATRKVEQGKAMFERDSVVFNEIEYSWPVLACLLRVAASQRSLRVMDFGGALGSSWRQNRRFLADLPFPVVWSVVEQDAFVELGRAEFATDSLRFSKTIEEASHDGIDVALFSSSLCYLAEPCQFLRELAAGPAKYLIVDRLPILSGTRDKITLQSVGEPIYTASYPIRLFGEDNLSSLFEGWQLVERWDCQLQPDPDSRSWGFFFTRP